DDRMKTEIRFFLAMLLMLGVLVGTNFLFPPVVEEVDETAPVAGEQAAGGTTAPAGSVDAGTAPGAAPQLPAPAATGGVDVAAGGDRPRERSALPLRFLELRRAHAHGRAFALPGAQS